MAHGCMPGSQPFRDPSPKRSVGHSTLGRARPRLPQLGTQLPGTVGMALSVFPHGLLLLFLRMLFLTTLALFTMKPRHLTTQPLI